MKEHLLKGKDFARHESKKFAKRCERQYCEKRDENTHMGGSKERSIGKSDDKKKSTHEGT